MSEDPGTHASGAHAAVGHSTSVGIGEVLDRRRKPDDPTIPRIVEFRNVTKTYNSGTPQAFTAIRDVTFSVADLPGKGEFICVLGPSGCGKSTILRLIAGLEPQHPPTTGEVLVAGQPVTGPGADRGMVFQDYTSFDNRSVLDNITFGLECQGVARKLRYDLGREWIKHVGLNVDRDAEKYPHELSGGMRQRVAIARTLILRPRIILMDEPFGALDPQTRMNMQDLLVSLWREVEATVFFVTHSIEEAVFLGDRVYVMGHGPGTILQELHIQPADRPAQLMQRDPQFQETVYYIRDLIARLEAEGKHSVQQLWRREDTDRKIVPREPRRLVNFGKYLKTAFLNQWNLLAFLGASGFALLSGQAEFILPLIMAGEVAYVGLLGAHPKFQKYVDSQDAKATRAAGSEQTQQALASITRSLPPALFERFETLRNQCLELRQIALEIKHPGKVAVDMPLDQFQLSGLDRLLWIHLRLLYTQFALGRFLQKTSEDQINADIKRLQKRIGELHPDANQAQDQRVRKALEDNLETSRTRLANVSKAKDNYELVKLEIDRLENKIRSLSELAVNRQEPEYISGQVDQVANSMLETEKTMNDLQFATGLQSLDDEAPELLKAKITQ